MHAFESPVTIDVHLPSILQSIITVNELVEDPTLSPQRIRAHQGHDTLTQPRYHASVVVRQGTICSFPWQHMQVPVRCRAAQAR